MRSMETVTVAVGAAAFLAGCVAYPERAPYGNYYPYANYYNEPYYDPFYSGFGYVCCFDDGFRRRHFLDHDRDHDHDHRGGGSHGGGTAGGGTFVNPSVGSGGLGDVPHGGPGTTPGPGTTGGGTYVQPGGRR